VHFDALSHDFSVWSQASLTFKHVLNRRNILNTPTPSPRQVLLWKSFISTTIYNVYHLINSHPVLLSLIMMKPTQNIARNMERLSPSTLPSTSTSTSTLPTQSRVNTPIVYKSALSSSPSIPMISLQNHHIRVPSSNIVSPSQSVWSLEFLGKEEFRIPPFEKIGCAPTPSSPKFEHEAPSSTIRTSTTITTATKSSPTTTTRKKSKHVRRNYVLDGSQQQNCLYMMTSDDADVCQTTKHPRHTRRNRALTAEQFDLILGEMVPDVLCIPQ
jgi:hypothetical protein